MDIKSKKFDYARILSRQWYCKFAAFVLLIAFCAAASTGFFLICRDVEYTQAISSSSYAESDICQIYFGRVTNNVMAKYYGYGGEDNILKGNTVTIDDIHRYLYNHLGQKGWDFPDNEEGDVNSSAFDEYVKQNPEKVEQARQTLIRNDLRNYQNIERFLADAAADGIYYYVEKNGVAESNLPAGGDASPRSQIEAMPIHGQFNFADGNVQFEYIKNDYYSLNISNEYCSRIPQYDTLLIGLTAESLNAIETEWELSRRTMNTYLLLLFLCGLGSFAAFVYLGLVTGRRPEDETVHFCFIDRMYSECHGLLAFLLFLGAFGVISAYAGPATSIDQLSQAAVPIAIALCTMTAGMMILFLSLVRKAKARRFLHGFLCWRIFKWAWLSVWRFFKRLFRGVIKIATGGSLMYKVMMASILIPILSATWFGTPFMMLLMMYFGYRSASRFQAVSEGVKRVKSGELDYKITIAGDGEFVELANNINTLSSGLDSAISSEIRSERMKTELISNVSHDIKTPLTSIITYVDLLKNEKINNPKAMEYIGIIERKAQRLKVLTTDLFEAAKATSGAIAVELETLDLGALIRQGLGEMNDKISASGLDFRVSMQEEPLYISADGRLMWRVLENLISNAVKYALPNSRVYVDVTADDTNAVLVMKNISAYELNIPANELMERFTRGDESRNSEGSGLGLNIANSLTSLQKGTFQIEIDGDLFKVIVTMPRVVKKEKKN